MQASEYLDKTIKNIVHTIMTDGTNGEWEKVHDGLRELCFCCKVKGLGLGDFELLRKEIIQALEMFQPFAKTHIEQAERYGKLQ